MILKEKNNDIALRSLSEIFDDIQIQTQTGNFGFIFSSSYTINPYVKLVPGTRNLHLVDVFRGLPANVATLFLLPPPAVFYGDYRTSFARNALELMRTGVLVWFDRFVHSKFLLFWSFDHTRFIEHRRYYGSTNFTQRGLIINIEEFYNNRRGGRYTVNLPRSHTFYLDTALKRVKEINEMYKSPDYWTKNLGDLQNKIQEIIDDLKQKTSVAKDLIEKLRVSMLSYSYMLDVLSDLWNLPGKQFAHNKCEKLLMKVDDYSGFNLEFLEELMTWPKEILIKFIKRREIDTNIYLEITGKVIEALLLLEDDIEKYKEKGYETFLYNEEKEFVKRLNDRNRTAPLLVIRKLMREQLK